MSQNQEKLSKEEKARLKELKKQEFLAKHGAELAKKKQEKEAEKQSKSARQLGREKQQAARQQNKSEDAKRDKQPEHKKIADQVSVDEVDFVNLSLTHKKEQLPIPSNQLIAAKQPVKQPPQSVKQSPAKQPQPAKQPLQSPKQIDVGQSRPSKPPTRATKSSPIADNRGQIFAHIPKRRTDLNELTKSLGYRGERIHSAMIRIGLKMNQNQIYDPTSRCIAFLVALKTVVEEYVPCASKPIARDLEQKLDEFVQFLDQCRPLSVSMRNVIRIMRSYISKLNAEWSVEQARSHLLELIDKFVYEEIECGLNGIREHGNLKIAEDDVILTFGDSFLIKHIFREAKQAGKRFRVIVVDSAPRLDGKKLVQFLGQLDIDATYVLINALSYVMKEVNKVLLEAHTLLANGYMISEMGASQIALVAKSHNVPVLICCETYKFSERVHTDSFVFNEADSAKDFFTSNHLNSDLRKRFTDEKPSGQVSSPANLNILNLYYDVTPRDFISLVITEMGFLPSTAVPAIIRRNMCKFQIV